MDSGSTRTMAAIALLLLLGLGHLGQLADAKTFLHCGRNGNSKPSSAYRANVRTVIQRMGRFTIQMPDLAYRTFELKPDVYAMSFCSTANRGNCRACIKAALRDLNKCGNRFGATGTRKDCKVRYDYYQFF